VRSNTGLKMCCALGGPKSYLALQKCCVIGSWPCCVGCLQGLVCVWFAVLPSIVSEIVKVVLWRVRDLQHDRT
jgi:hypothetical protein